MKRLALAAVPAVTALLVLTGWLLDIPFLERAGTPFVTMNPATAIGMILCSAMLLALYRPPCRRNRTIVMLFLAVMFTGCALKFSDLFLESDFAIDTTLFATQMIRGGNNKMAPNAAFNFFLVSLAIFLSCGKNRAAWVASQVIALVCGFIAFLAVVGYTYGHVSFYGVGSFTPMALHTALCFIMLCAGILAIHPHDALMKVINNRGPAGRMSRLLIPASILIPVAIGELHLQQARSHLYTVEFGISLSVVCNVAILFIVTWISARLLYVADRQQQAVENELHYRASHDRLTGLTNRRGFFDRVQQRLDLMKRQGGGLFAVLYLDLDGFKTVNNRLGHEAGDRLLLDVAGILLDCSRSLDTVARLGSDEFSILLEQIESMGDVHSLAARILKAMPRTVGEQALPVQMSIGIAVGKQAYATSEDIVRDASLALYNAKAAGKGTYRLYGLEGPVD